MNAVRSSVSHGVLTNQATLNALARHRKITRSWGCGADKAWKQTDGSPVNLVEVFLPKYVDCNRHRVTFERAHACVFCSCVRSCACTCVCVCVCVCVGVGVGMCTCVAVKLLPPSPACRDHAWPCSLLPSSTLAAPPRSTVQTDARCAVHHAHEHPLRCMYMRCCRQLGAVCCAH